MISGTPIILCVDDNPANLRVLETMLAAKGYEIVMANSGAQAFNALQKQSIDLILLDAMMPDMDGFEVCRSIKRDTKLRNIPVVMITTLSSTEDRIKGIEAGAEDFISKPFDRGEVLARAEMLLKVKGLHDELVDAYETITNLINFGERIIMSFNPLSFNLISSIELIVGQILGKQPEIIHKPQKVIVGILDDNNQWLWFQYEQSSAKVQRSRLDLALQQCLNLPKHTESRMGFYNGNAPMQSEMQSFAKQLESASIALTNAAYFFSSSFCLFALNYNRVISSYEAEVLNSIVMQSLYLKSLSAQVKETEHAFDYMVYALARAAEANDIDTGNHIMRVGEYCALISKELGMSEQFVNIIRIQATLHDVGKIHVPPEILRKPDRLLPEEFEMIKQHPIYGARILGDHIRLSVARNAALTHHEKWDGSGYPYGLKGEQIPLEGRILSIADQYDALRNPRCYKPAFDHETTYKIITEGDGRIEPYHFDPQVLKAFKALTDQFALVYEQMK